jgi:hypothetical protein
LNGNVSFVDACLAGDCDAEAIHDFIDQWHEGGTGVPLWQFLGMTRDEYGLWMEDADALPAILYSHRFGVTVEEALRSLRVAARGANAETIEKVERWIKDRTTRPA